ncbi:Glycoside superfamily [Micractinium conductrix]|uniref:Glycoside superfamily n=1 Tax=Micractinium conductrix TaxID=554055 RepID=A0A2P6V4A2_9CHLO|nr:Glycoside superfamily [Micractinium conductrix]|eukprot:PSC68907.1 Glycoside superfamily [Micractinium conductrix]
MGPPTPQARPFAAVAVACRRLHGAARTPAMSTEEPTIQYDVNELPVYDFLHYWPSLALAIVALVLFTSVAAVTAWMTERRRMYRFVHLVTATALLECCGYAALIYATVRSGKGSVFNAYVAMQVFVIEAPNIAQACMYLTIGKVLAHSPALTRGRKMLRGWVIATCFAAADLIAIIVQAIGISIWAVSQSSGTPDQHQIRLGCAITLAGLAIQLLFFVAFTAFAIWTHRHPQNGLGGKRETKRLFTGLYIAMAFLYVRNIFRFVEFTQNTVLSWPAPNGTYVLAHQQILFYTLDALPVLLCLVTYICFHPGYLLPSSPPPPPAAAAPATHDAEAGSEGGSLSTAGKGEPADFKVAAVA